MSGTPDSDGNQGNQQPVHQYIFEYYLNVQTSLKRMMMEAGFRDHTQMNLYKYSPFYQQGLIYMQKYDYLQDMMHIPQNL